MPPDNDQDDDARQRTNLKVAGVVILLLVVSVWLLVAFKKSTAELDCVAAGHHHCDAQ